MHASAFFIWEPRRYIRNSGGLQAVIGDSGAVDLVEPVRLRARKQRKLEMRLHERCELLVAHTCRNLLDCQSGQRTMRIDVFDEHPLSGAMCSQGLGREHSARMVAQVVDVIQTGIAEPQTENVENAFGAVDCTAIVGKADFQQLVAEHSSQTKHGDQLLRLILSRFRHCPDLLASVHREVLPPAFTAGVHAEQTRSTL